MIRTFGLISDTHGTVHKDVHAHFAGVEAILHSGDVGGGVLDELHLIAPVHAVCGNTDHGSPALPASRVVELPFGKAGLAHGHLQSPGVNERHEDLFRLFAPLGVRLILTGHSHEQFLRTKAGVWLVNPGAATHPRFRQQSGLCVLSWDPDRDLLQFDFRALDWS